MSRQWRLIFSTCNSVLHLEFPEECDRFEGPHSIKCYEAVWTEVGCVQEDFSAVDPSLFRADALENLNLKYSLLKC